MSKFTPNQSGAAVQNQVGSFQMQDIRRSGSGQAAASAEVAGGQQQKNSRFSLHPQVRQSLKIDQLEQAAVEDRVRVRMAELEEGIREKAHAEGHMAGLEQGRQEAYAAAKSEASDRLAQFEAMIRSFETAKAEVFAQNERFLLDLVLQIAHTLAKKTVAQDSEFLKRVILEIIEKAGLKGSLKIRVCPQDLENVKTFLPTLAAAIPDFKNVDILPDAAVSQGACAIQSEWGEIHTSLMSQFERVTESLLGPSA